MKKSTIDQLIINSPYGRTKMFLQEICRRGIRTKPCEHTKRSRGEYAYSVNQRERDVDGRDKTKRNFLDEWVKAVNQYGGFGTWKWAVLKNHADVEGIISDNA